MRYFLIDKVTEVSLGEFAKGVKCITYTDNVLHDHFPDYPIMPGALIIEAVAQLAGFLLEVTYNQNPDSKARRAVFVQVERMKFFNTSGPGDKLEIKVNIENKLEDAAQVLAEVVCDGEVRAKGRLTFSLQLIDSQNVVKQRQDLYRVWMRDLKNPPVVR